MTSIKLILDLDTSFPIAQNNTQYYELTNKIGIRCVITYFVFLFFAECNDGEDIELKMSFVGSCQIPHFLD